MPHSPLHREELQTEEQFERAQEAARELGFGSVLGAQKSLGLGTITSEDLVDSEPKNFQTAPPPTTTDISGLEVPDFELSGAEQQASDITERTRKLRQELLGETAFREEQRRETGLTESQRRQRDLAAQLKSLQLRSKSLENQKQLEAERILQESTARGRTRAGIAPLVAAAQRKFALEQSQVASQALIVAAELSAVEGNIQTANQQIEQAVQARFQPIREQIEANLFNLDLIAKDPRTTADEKRRAEAQKQAQEARAREVERQETDFENAQKLVLDLVQNNPDMNSAVRAELRKFNDPIGLTEFAQQQGLRFGATIETTGDIAQFQQAQALGIAPQGMGFFEFLEKRDKAKGAGGLTQLQVFDRELKLAGNFERATAEARDARRQQGQMEAGLENAKQRMKDGEGINAASQAVLVTFQKILDPTSVVRESEYARSGSGLSLLGRIQGFATKIQRGGAGVTVKDLEEFVELGREFLKGYEATVLNQAQLVKNQADSIGANIANILPPSELNMLRGIEEGKTPEQKTIIINGQEFIEGDIIINQNGQRARVLSDGRLEFLE